jgi:hypothetical protein
MIGISVIIPTFNSSRFITGCLESLKGQAYRDFETIIIDNGSVDGTSTRVRAVFPGAKLIINHANLGACKARNQGIRIARGQWILTLDCDVELKQDFFLEFVKIAKDLPAKTGMVQAKILQSDRRHIFSTGIFVSFLRRFYDIGMGRPDNQEFAQPRLILGGCSAASFLRKQMLEETKGANGYFDERFFFLVEDVDLAWRARCKGWMGVYRPELVCYHQGNSSGTDKKLRQYLCFRNRFYAIMNNEGLHSYLGKVFPFLFYDLPRFCFLFFNNPHLRRHFKRCRR